jgi:hypothetical protein
MLKQNWDTGDFDTSIRDQSGAYQRYKADGVQFLRSQIMKIVPASSRVRAQPNARGQNRPAGTKIFIGHGHSAAWRELKDFMSNSPPRSA